MPVEEGQFLGWGGGHRSSNVVQYSQKGFWSKPDCARRSNMLVRLGKGQGLQQPEVKRVTDLVYHCLGAGIGDNKVSIEREMGAVLLHCTNGKNQDGCVAQVFGHI